MLCQAFLGPASQVCAGDRFAFGNKSDSTKACVKPEFLAAQANARPNQSTGSLLRSMPQVGATMLCLRFFSNDRAILHRATAIGIEQLIKTIKEVNLLTIEYFG